MAEHLDNRSRIILLGTGTPNADPMRSGPSTAIIVNEQTYLIDFGPGLVRRAAAAFRMGVHQLAPDRLDLAFLTHLHSDHTAGYPDLILTPWVLGREKPLTVYGPEGLYNLTNHILQAYQADIQERITGLEPANQTGHHVEVHEIVAGIIFQNSDVRVEAFPTRHGSWQTYGYCFDTPGRRIVITGDTGPNLEALLPYENCDVLIHEVYSTEGFRNHTRDWQRYHRNVHTSTHELANIANRVKPKLLILYHQLFWGTKVEELIAEIHETYLGEIVSGVDLGEY